VKEEFKFEEPSKPQPFEYEFWINHGTAFKVAVAGEFTGWKPTIILQKQGGGRWSGKATIPNDGTKSQYQFKFVVNDKDWILNSGLP
jgi:hypothetical protein